MIKLSEYLDAKAFGVAMLIAALTSCNAGSSLPAANTSSTGTQSGNYIQIERLARPAIKEAFQMYTDHATTNTSNPYSDPLLPAAIQSFESTVAGRTAVYGQTLSAILIPDELQADLSQTNVKGAYLGVETGGATGTKFGGRELADDVIDTSLGAIFGTTLSDLGLVTADGKNSPCLTTDNEPGNNTADGNTTVAAITAKNGVGTTFPYLGVAH